MSIIIKAGLLCRGTPIVSLKSSFKRSSLVSLVARNTRHVGEPLAQARFYSSEEKLSPNNRERLYDGILAKKIRFVKIFSLTSSAGSIMCQPYLISKAMAMNSAVTAGGVVIVFGFFAFVTPLLLHLITKRYVVYVDYDAAKDTYIAGLYTIFARNKEIEFTPKDVSLPVMSEMLTTCIVKGMPMFMDVRLFEDIEHYKRIMGFDKPMDFSMDTDDVKTRKD